MPICVFIEMMDNFFCVKNIDKIEDAHFYDKIKKQNKLCIITGANSGIGFENAKILSKFGYKVILACRSLEKANLAIQKIKEDVEEADLLAMSLDVSSFKSIDKFVQEFIHTHTEKV